MEIERKFTVKQLPENLSSFRCLRIEQAYLCTGPVVRIRKEDDHYYLTYKGSGVMSHEEYNLPLTETAYLHLLEKADGNVIRKSRYLIPIAHPAFGGGYVPEQDPAANGGMAALTVELDVFNGPFRGLIIAEVEFPSEEMANAFLPLDWFDEDVTRNEEYHNSYLSEANPLTLHYGKL
jgi:adenylate cyclase